MDQIMDLLKQQQVSSSGGGPTTPKITPSSRGATLQPLGSVNYRFGAEAAGKNYDFLGFNDFLSTSCSMLDIRVTGICA
jgi:hypothetical protein